MRRGSLIIVLGFGLKISLSGISMGMRLRFLPSSLSGVLSPAVQKLSSLLDEGLAYLRLSGLAGVSGHWSGSVSESLLLLLLLLLLSELLPLVALLLDDGLAGLYLFNFSLILDVCCCLDVYTLLRFPDCLISCFKFRLLLGAVKVAGRVEIRVVPKRREIQTNNYCSYREFCVAENVVSKLKNRAVKDARREV